MRSSPTRPAQRPTRIASATAIAVSLLAGPTPPPPVASSLFGEGTISTRDFERDGTFSPDGKTFYFTKRTIWPYFNAICASHLRGGHWSEPEVASFSGQFPDATPFVSPDGNALYFASRRPLPNGGPAGYHLWVVDRRGDDWGDPHPLPDVVNPYPNQLSPAVTRAGTLFFVGGPTGRAYRAERDGDTWKAPVPLPADTTTGGSDVSIYVDPDERLMIVSITGRSDALHSAEGLYARSDLYLRERVGTEWSPARHLPAPINSSAHESGQATLTPDGRFLVFTSERGYFTEHGKPLTYATLERELHGPRNGLGDIYVVDARALGAGR